LWPSNCLRSQFPCFWHTTTTIGSRTIIEHQAKTFTSAFTLKRAFISFSIAFAAFFAFAIIDFCCSFYAFFAATTCNLASFSAATLAFFIAISFAFCSLSSLF
jgi:hypothetical protein